MADRSLFEFNRKILAEHLERYTGVSLTPGYNPVQMEVPHKNLKLTLQIGVVVPNNQRTAARYAFVLLKNISVDGRGSLKYGNIIEKRFLLDLDDYAPKSPLPMCRPDGAEQLALIGYDLNNNYEAVYATFRSVAFAEEHETTIDGTYYLEKVPVALSTPERLEMYRLDTLDQPVKSFLDDGVYILEGFLDQEKTRNQLHRYQNDPLYRYPSDKQFLLDNRNRLWVKQANLTVGETVDAELNGRGFALGTQFYEPADYLCILPPTADCLFYRKHVYRPSPNITVLTEDVGEPVPFMDTLIPAALGVLANGAYATVELAGVRTVIVPVVDICAEPKATFLAIGGRVYAVIGPVADIGFLIATHVFYSRIHQLRVGLRPAKRGVFFCDTPRLLDFTNYGEEINREMASYETPVIHDEAFRNRKPAWVVGDTVTVTAELTNKSRLVGVSGTIEEIWPNRAGARVSFFEHFEEDVPFENLTRANKTPALVNLSV